MEWCTADLVISSLVCNPIVLPTILPVLLWCDIIRSCLFCNYTRQTIPPLENRTPGCMSTFIGQLYPLYSALITLQSSAELICLDCLAVVWAAVLKEYAAFGGGGQPYQTYPVSLECRAENQDRGVMSVSLVWELKKSSSNILSF